MRVYAYPSCRDAAPEACSPRAFGRRRGCCDAVSVLLPAAAALAAVTAPLEQGSPPTLAA